MIDASKTELQAILHAGQMAGEFLDSLKITDLSRMTQAQYNTFIRCAVSAYLGQIAILQVAAAKDFPLPF